MIRLPPFIHRVDENCEKDVKLHWKRKDKLHTVFGIGNETLCMMKIRHRFHNRKPNPVAISRTVAGGIAHIKRIPASCYLFLWDWDASIGDEDFHASGFWFAFNHNRAVAVYVSYCVVKVVRYRFLKQFHIRPQCNIRIALKDTNAILFLQL